MMRLRSSACLAIAAALFVLPHPTPAQQPAFPHARHAKLFPTCTGCHAGIATGDAPSEFPAQASCATCHDGKIQRAVTWARAARRGAGLLKFSHPAHLAKSSDATCTSCHSAAGATAQWMNVAKAQPATCIACHSHQAPDHLSDQSKCTTCHRPLTQATAITEAKIAELPKPASHAAPGFVAAHGKALTANPSGVSTCATCHARESCARCHVDASRNVSIASLGNDARVARAVAGKAPVYPAPESHKSAEFLLTHGGQARYVSANCATCHARPSCETCHLGNGTTGGASGAGDPARDVIRALPAGGSGSAPGVLLRRAPRTDPANPALGPVATLAASWTPAPHRQDTVRTVRVHPLNFPKTHGRVAASGELTCANCHAQRFCSDCHAAERSTRRFHPANFVSVHAPQAYARETNCTGCHNTQVFCRDCHSQVGLAVKSPTQRTATYHNARPLWLLQHGQAARQDLVSCTTCHQQTYCMQCHSQLGARINPHGPNFDASRMAARNSRICLACHFTNPLAK